MEEERKVPETVAKWLIGMGYCARCDIYNAIIRTRCRLCNGVLIRKTYIAVPLIATALLLNPNLGQELIDKIA